MGPVKGGSLSNLLKDIPIPKMFRAEQSFKKDRIEPEQIPKVVREQLSRPEISSRIQPGMNIAITAGSRGIANVNVITRAIVDYVKKKGAYPFIVPAMGSHGGAKAESQKELLAGYGITEEAMGCPIRSSMETVLLGYSEYGKPVYQDKNAHEADGIIVSCRIKPHNAFRGPYESGVCKMMVVGLGKQKGAESVHSDGLGNMARNLPANAKVVVAFLDPVHIAAHRRSQHIKIILVFFQFVITQHHISQLSVLIRHQKLHQNGSEIRQYGLHPLLILNGVQVRDPSVPKFVKCFHCHAHSLSLLYLYMLPLS